MTSLFTDFSVVTVNANYPPAHVVNAAPPQLAHEVLLFNNDPVNTIWVGSNNAFQAGDVNHATPLQPKSSVTFDGTADIYASCTAGLTAALFVYPTGASYAGGMSLSSLVQLGSLSVSAGINIAASGSYTALNLVDVSSYASYDLSMYVFTANKSSGSPNAVKVVLQWFDDLVSGVPVFQEEWWPFCGLGTSSNANAAAIGTGPMHGRYMTLQIVNPTASTAQITVQYINVFGSPRTTPYSDWRQSGVLSQMGDTLYTQPAAAPFQGDTTDNLLLSLSTTTGANQNLIFPIGMYSGPVGIYFNSTSNFNSNPGLFSNAPGSISGSLATTSGELFQWGIGPAKQYQVIFIPRGGSYILVQTLAAVTLVLSVTAQQAA